MIVAATKEITKTYGADPVLGDITMEIHSGSRVGIVGPNGAGKTTLFKLLIGIETADKGEIFRAKGSKWAYLPQSPQYPVEWSGRDVIQSAFEAVGKLSQSMRDVEQAMAAMSDRSSTTDSNLQPAGASASQQPEQLLHKYQALQEEFERLGGYETDVRMNKVIEGLGISAAILSTPFAQLSGGEKTKVGLAKLLCEQSDVLLLDEPTNHLDVESMEWLEQFLRDYAGVVVIISHDRYFLDAVVTSIYEVDGGEAAFYHGNYSAFVKEKEERLLRHFAEYQEQQKKIKKMKETIKRLKEWGNQSNPPNEAFHRRAKSMEKALERMEKIERPRMEVDRMGLQFQKIDRSGQDVLVADGVHKSFAGKELFTGTGLTLRYGERKALLGVNGSGKSTFIKMLLGELEPDRGTVKIGSNVKVGYLSQQALEGDPKRRVIDAFREIVHVTEAEARHKLARFLFYGENVFKKVGSLSGGERMRLRLAQLMHQEINLLILDEPTNHLDIPARETLEEAIAEYQGSLFIVSHDRYFLQKTVKGVFWIENNQIVRYEGTYEESREKQRQMRSGSGSAVETGKSAAVQSTDGMTPQTKAETAPNQPTANTAKPAPEKKINKFKLQQLEQEIATLEARREELAQQLADGGQDYQALMQLQAEYDACEKKVEQLYESWYSMQG
ncbi:ribosomal protection-like ABC-F family protein [Brevibacillus dissolubilis]|uniref:ribosomal protection-like ABC-F family protein n=1 Tax=Brevibacillus dissolubilis TaxID=1844116 RepID=UPI001115F48B|nr:ABC-F type ribosomal protection protein [Brevibacillus dissolubilis]